MENRYLLKVYPETRQQCRKKTSMFYKETDEATGNREKISAPRARQNDAHCGGGCLTATSEDTSWPSRARFSSVSALQDDVKTQKTPKLPNECVYTCYHPSSFFFFLIYFLNFKIFNS